MASPKILNTLFLNRMKNFKYLLLSLVLFQSLLSKAQGLSQVYKVSSNPIRSAFHFVFDTPKGYDVFGSMTYTNSSGNLISDILFTKLNSCGQVQNTFKIGGIETSYLKKVFLNSSGNYDVICERTLIVSGQRDKDIFAFELTPNGSVVKTKWIKRHASSIVREQIYDVVQCSTGGYLISGFDDGSAPYLGQNKVNPSILKLDRNLNPIWFKSYNTELINSSSSSLIELPTKSLITSSWNSNGKSILRKYNFNGKAISSKQISGSNSNLNFAIYEGIYLNEACYFIAYAGRATYNYMVLKTDTNLNPIWAKQYFDGSGANLRFSSIHSLDNQIYLSGFQNSTGDNMTLKVDTSGKVNWTKKFSKMNYAIIDLSVMPHKSKGNLTLFGGVLNKNGLNQYPAFIASK